jgi:hypothetical protein
MPKFGLLIDYEFCIDVAPVKLHVSKSTTDPQKNGAYG